MKTPTAFLDALNPGDLVAGTVASSTKLHLVTVTRRVTREMVQGSPTDEYLATLFDCKPLCEVRPRYFWRPTDQHESWAASDKCRWCFSKWRAQGRPVIKGWAKPEKEVTSDIKLPWGWHEVTPLGHPLDLPAEADDPEDGADENKGAKRIEKKRWVRGTRYIRITQSLTDGRYTCHYGALTEAPDDERWNAKGGYERILLRAVSLMAQGGQPTTNTQYDKLTMRDIALRGEK